MRIASATYTMAEQSKEILKDKHIRHAEVNNSVIFNNACVIAKRIIDYSFPVKQGSTKKVPEYRYVEQVSSVFNFK